jgi:hypothetical protein
MTNHTQLSQKNMTRLKELSHVKTPAQEIIMNRMKARSTYGQLEQKDPGNAEGV